MNDKTALKTSAQSPANPEELFSGGGEMGALMRQKDWAATRLGPVESWSPALRMMARFLLANRFPLLLWWGPDFCQLYNDAYRPILGTKHPHFLGQPVRECWSEIWHILEPLIRTPFEGGPATWMEDILLEINRYGFMEETHFTIAYSPVPDESAPRGIGGVLATVHEISEKVVGERRTMALRDLSAGVLEERSAEEACARAAEILANYPKDIPFSLLYLLDADRKLAHLAGSSGVNADERISPATITLQQDDPALWPLFKAMESGEIEVVDDLSKRVIPVPAGPWADPPSSAAVVPIHSNIAHQLAGFMVAGLSSRLRYDDFYRGFLDLTSSQIATAVANARAYEEERKRAEALAEIDRAKTAFFTNISHEFRTPLTLLLTPIEETLAKPNANLGEDEREHLEMAHRNGMRLLKLVNALLDFSRIEAGRLRANYRPLDICTLTRDLASMFRSTIERAGLSLAIECQPLQEPIYVDRDMWEKIVLNLLSNAFKFTFDGGIQVQLQDKGDHVELAVNDTGTGIPEGELSRLFERFYRVEGAHGRTFEGSGVGLALVQELVKLHGGAVTVESAVGKGSTFRVSIPKGNGHLPQEHIDAGGDRASADSNPRRTNSYVSEALRWIPNRLEQPTESPTEEVAPAQGETPVDTQGLATERPAILLADDNSDMRDYVRKLLEEHYRVMAVNNGLEALQVLEKSSPDLILSDVMMPGLDGFGLLRAVRGNPATASTPVIFLSARAGEEAKMEGRDAGADDYLIKPFSARELLARVGAQIRLKRMREEADARVRENEKRLRRSEAELRTALIAAQHLAAIVESSDDAIASKDLNGIVTSWNKSAERLFGYKAAEIIGKPITTIIPTELLADEDMILGKIRKGEKIDHFETVRVAKSGERIDVSLSISPVRNEQGRIIGAAKVVRDVTQNKKIERALRTTEKLAAAGRLAATVAHEINNPLEAVHNLVFLARRDVTNSEKVAEYLQMAQRELDRVSHIARQTLGFYRDTSAPTQISMVKTLDDLLFLYEKRLEVRNIRVVKQYKDQGEIRALAGEVRQALSNL
ncbi:MAG TPA: PAS domain S-box protein, partial [Candidatus Angelobacter sp.]|nr:PAS domain S-box protein [Candidatus Angelobacter sp.]